MRRIGPGCQRNAQDVYGMPGDPQECTEWVQDARGGGGGGMRRTGLGCLSMQDIFGNY